jgi:3-dehydroquinate synthase
MGMDKKVEGGKLRLILLERIGEAFVTANFPQQELRAVLAG